MLIRSVKLNNIRSYISEEIKFSEGITLLSGDIGGGKTTILLALEFALFGIMRGELSGLALLRHGSNEGSVELELEINNSNFIIKRGLKRTSNGVSQSAGYLIKNGTKVDCTAQELKSRILELLNYPKDLLNKSKSLIFRFTVYTPQEAMKNILYEKADSRIDTLRKIFDMDKYKRVKENTINVIKDYRREELILKERIATLEEDLGDEESLSKKISELKLLLEEREKKLQVTNKNFEDKNKEIILIEKQRFELEELKKKLAVTLRDIKNVQERILEIKKEKDSLKERVDEQEKNFKKSDVDEQSLLEQLNNLKKEEQELEEKRLTLNKKEAEANAFIKQANNNADKILNLDECPTCKQKVDETHKNSIRADAQRIIDKETERKNKLEQFKKLIKKKTLTLNEKKEELSSKKSLLEANKIKYKQLQDFKVQLTRLEKVIEQLKDKEKQEVAKKEAYEQELKEKNSIDEESLIKLKESLKLIQKEKELLLTKISEEKSSLKYEEEKLLKIKEKKEKQKLSEESLKKTQEKLTWLNKHIMNLAGNIEKTLFLSIYNVFNDYFKNWFSTLMEDESISARLDSEFTPLLTQNGYETYIDNLSGGEKTSLALAYRLALNKVINEFMDDINTKDILILDEPTDGFSSEQLDRVREVLEQLRLKQIIIVSHEKQVESFANNIVRVIKENHESHVI